MKDLRIGDVVSVTLKGMTIRHKNGQGITFTSPTDDVDVFLTYDLLDEAVVGLEKATIKADDIVYFSDDKWSLFTVIAVDGDSAWVRSHQTGDRRVFDLTELTRVSE